MSLEDLGSLGEALGAVGVIVSLIYLATQIRQNTRAVQSASVQAANLSIGAVTSLMGQSPQNADVFHRGLRSYDELSEPEQTHFLIMVAAVFSNFDAMYWDFRAGVLPTEIWEREQRLLHFYLSTPGGEAVWETVKDTTVSRPFAEFVASTEPAPSAPAA